MNSKGTILFLCSVLFLFPGQRYAHALCPADSTEQVQFYTSLAWPAPAPDVWSADVHAWTFKPELDFKRRRLILEALRRALGPESEENSQSGIFEKRIHAFLVTSLSKPLDILILGKEYEL